MDHFTYINGELHAERIPGERLAREFGTPCYVYSRRTLLDHCTRLREAFAALNPLICFSIKSCSNLAIIRALKDAGAGMDQVSGGELFRAMKAGVDPAQCVYAGVGKTDAEIAYAINSNVGWFNVESEAEFENISAIASRMKKTCRAALRVNPDVDPRTHRYTSTGKKESKFGVDIERARAFFRQYGRDRHCSLSGIHLHIGSPIYTIEPYVQAITKALTLIDELAGEGFKVDMLDLGGGFGADYQSDQSPIAADYAQHIVPLFEQWQTEQWPGRLARASQETGETPVPPSKRLQIILEPGRTIAAHAGILLTRVLYVKTSGDKIFAICDGGMNVLIRPSHYGSFHFLWPAKVEQRFVPHRRAERMEMPGLINVDVVGPVCESGDFLAIDRLLPPVKRGDLLAVFAAGAYGMVMASRYNSMPLPAEVMVDGERAQLIRRRETYDDLIEHEET